MTKKGCGRVVVGKELHIIHSYTLECGYHSSIQFRPIVDLRKAYPSSAWNYEQSAISVGKSYLYEKGPPDFSPPIYYNIGKQLLISIIDLLEMNPLSRIPHSQYKNNHSLRKFIAERMKRSSKSKRIFDIQDIDFIAHSSRQQVLGPLRMLILKHRNLPKYFESLKRTVTVKQIQNYRKLIRKRTPKKRVKPVKGPKVFKSVPQRKIVFQHNSLDINFKSSKKQRYGNSSHDDILFYSQREKLKQITNPKLPKIHSLNLVLNKNIKREMQSGTYYLNQIMKRKQSQNISLQELKQTLLFNQNQMKMITNKKLDKRKKMSSRVRNFVLKQLQNKSKSTGLDKIFRPRKYKQVNSKFPKISRI